MRPLRIANTFLARSQSEGSGATVRRTIGTRSLPNLTPFLMLDHFTVPPGAGFPDHPHRGQETITYLLSGGIEHEDFAGNRGKLGPGDLQFMTAGRGVVHAEMPDLDLKDADGQGVESVGLQLWVDLPKELKGCEPRYRDLKGSEVPIVEIDEGRVRVKVISGRAGTVDSVRDLSYTPVWILDITVQPDGSMTQEVPQGWNTFLYVLEGTATISDGDQETKEIGQYSFSQFERDETGDKVMIQNKGTKGDVRVLLVAGQPLDQPIVQYGPFVVTSRDEIMQAMMDYQTSSNGFERAGEWQSEIGRSMGRVH